MTYPKEATDELVKLVGERNYGIRFNPEWNSQESANTWIQKQRARAPEDQRAKWDNRRVVPLDLDRTKETPDNIVLFSDFGAGKIKSVDVFALQNRQRKEGLRAYYDAFPDAQVRQQVNKQIRSDVKAYYKKYNTPAKQANMSFVDFSEHRKDAENQNGFNQLKRSVERVLNRMGITMFTPGNSEKLNGTLVLTHYMTIVQKVTSFINHFFMVMFFSARYPDEGITNNYDFKKDDNGYKRPSDMKEYSNFIFRQGDQNVQNYITRNNVITGVQEVVLRAIAEINRKAGDTVVHAQVDRDNHRFTITDDLKEEQRDKWRRVHPHQEPEAPKTYTSQQLAAIRQATATLARQRRAQISNQLDLGLLGRAAATSSPQSGLGSARSSPILRLPTAEEKKSLESEMRALEKEEEGKDND
jgi:hypothetical protein